MLFLANMQNKCWLISTLDFSLIFHWFTSQRHWEKCQITSLWKPVAWFNFIVEIWIKEKKGSEVAHFSVSADKFYGCCCVWFKCEMKAICTVITFRGTILSEYDFIAVTYILNVFLAFNLGNFTTRNQTVLRVFLLQFTEMLHMTWLTCFTACGSLLTDCLSLGIYYKYMLFSIWIHLYVNVNQCTYGNYSFFFIISFMVK